MTALPAIPEEIVAVVAADPSGLMFSVRDALRSQDSRVVETLECYLAALPSDAVATTLEDPQFRFVAARSDDHDREARIWLTERVLEAEIPRRRVSCLRSHAMARRPRLHGDRSNAPIVRHSNLAIGFCSLPVASGKGSRFNRKGRGEQEVRS